MSDCKICYNKMNYKIICKNNCKNNDKDICNNCIINLNINNINQLVQDSLTQKNISNDADTYENVLSYPLKQAREKFEKNYLTSQLKKHKGNISKTAEFIGMERSALHRKLKTLGVKGVN